MGRTHFQIRRLKKEDEEALFDFRKRILPADSRDLDRQYWRWKFLRHPSSKKIPFFIIEAENRIVGTQGYWPMQLIANGNEMSCAHLVDFNVEDSFRGLPVVKLFKTVCSNAAINFGANLSKEAKHFFHSARWIDASPYLNSLYCFLKKPDGMRGPVDKAKFAVRSAATAFKLKQAIKRRPLTNHEIIKENSCPDMVDNLLAGSRSAETTYFKKDANYFRWRYDQCPLNTYEYILLVEEDKPKILLVTTVTKANNMKKAIIMDLVKDEVSQDSLAFFLASYLLDCRENNISLVETTTTVDWLKQILTNIGFSCIPSNLGLMHSQPKDARLCQRNLFPFILGQTDRY